VHVAPHGFRKDAYCADEEIQAAPRPAQHLEQYPEVVGRTAADEMQVRPQDPPGQEWQEMSALDE
jgi:hypothetical protein